MPETTDPLEQVRKTLRELIRLERILDGCTDKECKNCPFGGDCMTQRAEQALAALDDVRVLEEGEVAAPAPAKGHQLFSITRAPEESPITAKELHALLWHKYLRSEWAVMELPLQCREEG